MCAYQRTYLAMLTSTKIVASARSLTFVKLYGGRLQIRLRLLGCTTVIWHTALWRHTNCELVAFVHESHFGLATKSSIKKGNNQFLDSCQLTSRSNESATRSCNTLLFHQIFSYREVCVIICNMPLLNCLCFSSKSFLGRAELHVGRSVGRTSA